MKVEALEKNILDFVLDDVGISFNPSMEYEVTYVTSSTDRINFIVRQTCNSVVNTYLTRRFTFNTLYTSFIHTEINSFLNKLVSKDDITNGCAKSIIFEILCRAGIISENLHNNLQQYLGHLTDADKLTILSTLFNVPIDSKTVSMSDVTRQFSNKNVLLYLEDEKVVDSKLKEIMDNIYELNYENKDPKIKEIITTLYYMNYKERKCNPLKNYIEFYYDLISLLELNN